MQLTSRLLQISQAGLALLATPVLTLLLIFFKELKGTHVRKF